MPENASQEPPRQVPDKIDELEGLRGLLALWVAIYHVIAICETKVPARLWAILDGAHAVDVFIILSGFVIASLRLKKSEPYAIFITRRFLRIFPAYAVCIAAAIALAEFRVMPARFTSDNFGWLLAVHAAMLQGAVPIAIHPLASAAFLNPTWSVSLEWQFYLFAPFLVAAMARSPKSLLISGLATALMVKLLPVATATFGGMGPAFLFAKLPLFWLGIGSCLLFRHINSRQAKGIAAAILAVSAVVFSFLVPLHASLGVVIWIVALVTIIQVRTGRPDRLAGSVAALLSSRPILFLGSISYPLYLCHEPLIWVARRGALTFAPSINGWLLAAAVGIVAIPCSLFVAALLHRYIEQPTIEYGRRIGRQGAAP